MNANERERVAEAVRRACIRAAAEAYEDAGLAGLCAEGRWEAAIDAIRSLEVSRIEPSGYPPGEPTQ